MKNKKTYFVILFKFTNWKAIFSKSSATHIIRISWGAIQYRSTIHMVYISFVLLVFIQFKSPSTYFISRPTNKSSVITSAPFVFVVIVLFFNIQVNVN